MQSRWKRALVIASVTLILAAWALPPAFAQPAPVRRAVVPADAAPEAMAGLFADLQGGEQAISIPGAAWLQLQFSDVQLGPDGTLTITSAAGDSQSFSQAKLEAWGGLTAIFNGSELRVALTPGPGATEPVVARIADIIIGLPPAKEGAAESAPQPLIDLLGGDLDRFIPEDVRRPTTEGAAPEENGSLEAICGADDRVASNNPRSGRIMPVGCTGWLIDGGALLTAGHCTGATMQTVEFNVPASQADGTTVSPPVRDQYRVTAGSIVTQNTGIGNDWAIFTVLPNTETGLLPAAAQGATFQLSNTQSPANVRITGFGLDGPPPAQDCETCDFGNLGPRDTTNQTQQTHVGTLSTNTGGANSGTLRYSVDTQGGNSGSPVIVEGGNVAIGIHTNGGCTFMGGTNAGTSFRNQALWTAIAVRTAMLDVRKILVHPDHNHFRLFDLQIDGVTVRANVNAGSTGPHTVSPGNHTVGEIIHQGAFGTFIGGDCAEDGTVSLAMGESKTCTITNFDNTGGCPITSGLCCEPGFGMQGCLQCGNPGCP